jgi:hypothetical protein
LQSAQLLFTLPWGQGLQSAQLLFTLPWGQGLHCAQLSFRVPCGHRLPAITRSYIPPFTPPRVCAPCHAVCNDVRSSTRREELSLLLEVTFAVSFVPRQIFVSLL